VSHFQFHIDADDATHLIKLPKCQRKCLRTKTGRSSVPKGEASNTPFPTLFVPLCIAQMPFHHPLKAHVILDARHE
jgi:hypothetical protein